jgi:hypothetical protein
VSREWTWPSGPRSLHLQNENSITAAAVDDALVKVDPLQLGVVRVHVDGERVARLVDCPAQGAAKLDARAQVALFRVAPHAVLVLNNGAAQLAHESVGRLEHAIEEEQFQVGCKSGRGKADCLVAVGIGIGVGGSGERVAVRNGGGGGSHVVAIVYGARAYVDAADQRLVVDRYVRAEAVLVLVDTAAYGTTEGRSAEVLVSEVRSRTGPALELDAAQQADHPARRGVVHVLADQGGQNVRIYNENRARFRKRSEEKTAFRKPCNQPRNSKLHQKFPDQKTRR